MSTTMALIKMRIEISKDDEAKVRALRTRALLNDDQLKLGYITEEEYLLTLADLDVKLKELEDKYGLSKIDEEEPDRDR